MKSFWLVLGYMALLLFGCAWMSDDALITLRYVLNATAGEGAVFEWGERVQGYTHPLWFLLLTGIAFMSGSGAVIAQVFMGPVFVLAAMLRLHQAYASSRWLALVVLLLCFSNGWVDFASSGLEGGLAVFLLVELWLRWRERELVAVGGIAGLLCLVRPDYLLVTLPFIWAVWRERDDKDRLPAVALFVLPIVLWHLFAFIYYGDPLPNTYYAKISTTIPRAERIAQGLAFFGSHLVYDAMSLWFVLGGLILGRNALRTHLDSRPLALGLFLYVAYTVWIGGDFMIGRFLQAPMVMAICLGLHHECIFNAKGRGVLAPRALMPVGYVQWVVAAAVVLSVVLSTKAFDGGYGFLGENRFVVSNVGVMDERSYYVNRGLGAGALLDAESKLSGIFDAAEAWATVVESSKAESRPVMTVCGTLGWRGILQARARLVDVCGLTDAFVSRIQFEPTLGSHWRMGHFSRKTQAPIQEYIATLRSGTDGFTTASSRNLFDEVRTITSGDLGSGDRLQVALIRFLKTHLAW
jgi:arabinofuranosyltransferase